MANETGNIVFQRPHSLLPVVTNFCPGCTHGIVMRLVAESIDELDIEGFTVGIAPVGCSVMAYDFFGCDMVEAAHGRAPAVATGVKRVNPDNIVFAYQGDGDLASIGMAETIHAATRGENITVIFINNAIYGMTGAQMAPTTLMGQTASTAPAPTGRCEDNSGYPVKMAEILAMLPGVCYSERVTVNTPARINQCKKAIKHAFELQLQGKGMGFVEVLSPCPTGWGMSAVKALDWIDEKMTEVYPLGVIKDTEKEDK